MQYVFEKRENYILEIVFENGTKKIYDVASLFEQYPSFLELKNNYELFKQVNVDVGGYGISWNDDIDISCNELWDNGQLVYDEDNSETVSIKENNNDDYN